MSQSYNTLIKKVVLQEIKSVVYFKQNRTIGGNEKDFYELVTKHCDIV